MDERAAILRVFAVPSLMFGPKPVARPRVLWLRQHGFFRSDSEARRNIDLFYRSDSDLGKGET